MHYFGDLSSVCISLRKLLKDISFVSGTALQKFFSSFWNNYFWNANPLDLPTCLAEKKKIKRKLSSMCSF